MSIITWMGASVSAYLADPYAWWDAVLDAQRCLHCQCPCRRHSVRKRAAWSQFLLPARESIPLLRIYCPQYCATFTILPDFLTPRHRYQVLVREAVVTSSVSVPPCCPQTVRRWRQAFGPALTLAIHYVTAKILQASVSLTRQAPCFLAGPSQSTLAGRFEIRPLFARSRPCGQDAPDLFTGVHR